MTENTEWDELRVERVAVRVHKTVEVDVAQENLHFLADGELVYVYVGDSVAILSRSEWDQIVGAL